VGNLILVLLEIYCSLQQWKNFANRSRIDKVIAVVRVAPFLTHGVCTSMRPVITDGVVWSVSLSVTIMSPAKTTEPMEMPFGLWTVVGPSNHNKLDGVQVPHGKRQFWGERRRSIVKYRDTLPWAVQKSWTNPDDIFGMWTWVGPRSMY